MYRPKYYNTYILPSPFWHKKGTDLLCAAKSTFWIQIVWKFTFSYSILFWVIIKKSNKLELNWLNYAIFLVIDMKTKKFLNLFSLLTLLEDILNSIIHQIVHHNYECGGHSSFEWTAWVSLSHLLFKNDCRW